MVNQFTGFGPETFAFLRDLTLHNDCDWFMANRARYEEHYLAAALGFIEAIGPRLAAELPGDVRFEARVNGSLFRINRDIRFPRIRRRTRITSTCGSGPATRRAGRRRATSCACCPTSGASVEASIT